MLPFFTNASPEDICRIAMRSSIWSSFARQHHIAKYAPAKASFGRRMLQQVIPKQAIVFAKEQPWCTPRCWGEGNTGASLPCSSHPGPAYGCCSPSRPVPRVRSCLACLPLPCFLSLPICFALSTWHVWVFLSCTSVCCMADVHF